MPSLEDRDQSYDQRVAGLLAVHLVSQVLDEAYVIANAAEESGQPWRYISMLKNVKSGRLSDGDDEDSITFVASQGDITGEVKADQVPVVVATSTPQKFADDTKPKFDPNLIGQGDEELDIREEELSKSTSMFINNLFDMSDVERVIECDDDDSEIEINFISDELITQAMSKIMESYVNTALNIAFEKTFQVETEVADNSKSIEHSCFSFLADVLDDDVDKDMTYYIENDVTPVNEKGSELFKVVSDISPVIEIEEVEHIAEIQETEMEKNDVIRYENAYLTLNRDYDQCSDFDGDDHVIHDPKALAFQEVKLVTASTSEENLSSSHETIQEEKKELAAISAVSAMSGSRKSKSSLASRCRSHGARILACLRGWWRRKTPGKRKEGRHHGSIRGLCPLSPDARRRAASLLDHRQLCSPLPARSVVWKFNTVNESLVKSSHWKDYTFEVDPDECGEY